MTHASHNSRAAQSFVTIVTLHRNTNIPTYFVVLTGDDSRQFTRQTIKAFDEKEFVRHFDAQRSTNASRTRIGLMDKVTIPMTRSSASVADGSAAVIAARKTRFSHFGWSCH